VTRLLRRATGLDDPAMRYDAGHKQKTRERVLTAAAKALRAAGPEKLSVAEVMRAAGLTVGGFYAHFRSKDDLLAHAVETAIADFNAGVERAGDDDAAPAERFERLVRFYLSRRHRDAPESGCPLPSLGGHVAGMDEEVRRRFAAGLDGLTGRLERLLGAMGVEAPAQAASSVAAEMIGAITLARAAAGSDRSDAVLSRSKRAILSRYLPRQATHPSGPDRE
jgi:TetR/AcrR family transcriptional regulator, transcriptional repressor for nem operon